MTEREVVVNGGLPQRARFIFIAVQAVLREGSIEAHATLRPGALRRLAREDGRARARLSQADRGAVNEPRHFFFGTVTGSGLAR
jgi:hypothetical protein